ncbi:hypothetical protein SAMD00079811_33060 [Scytonema sp. HK-05]|uniref:hypothetical protein n=1 Tax=Scytonema sp. HK-05 TaxID=1137095 RepID=UPI0009373526|nr:hypothetical protein [Scytonema sp. HK-05]OKH45580.1 hypothetical protein NIES2130_37035 [Scytonema sp. HK-05]BAY45699.1 hypothetical protein SAMD00079811_33060 [Scytonema sp. HK-05]
MANQSTELKANLFEELSDADLIAVVGGTGGSGVVQSLNTGIDTTLDGLRQATVGTGNAAINGAGTAFNAVNEGIRTIREGTQAALLGQPG